MYFAEEKTVLSTKIFLKCALNMKVKALSCVWLFAIPWTRDYQAPQLLGFSRQEYWSGLPFPPPGALPDPGMEPGFPALQADSLPSEPPGLHQGIQCTLKPQKVKWTQSCLTLCDPINYSLSRLPCPWDSPGKNTGVRCHFLLQGIFPTQGLNPGLPHYRQMLYSLIAQSGKT